MTVEQAKKLNARLYFLAKEFKLLNAYNKQYDSPKYETKATREVVERKLHTWYTDLWNSKMHKANEPGWCLVDELINLFGVDVVKQAISKLK